jgi:DNA-binding response OmpR family regulator
VQYDALDSELFGFMPLFAAGDFAMTPTTEPVKSPSASSPIHRLRVLVADDCEAITRLVAKFLTALGHDVVAARDGIETEKLLFSEGRTFDLFVTDVNMPGRNGLDLVARLRAEQCRMPVIIMGGFLTDSHRSWIEGLRIQAVLEKPFDLVDLQDALNRCSSD